MQLVQQSHDVSFPSLSAHICLLSYSQYFSECFSLQLLVSLEVSICMLSLRLYVYVVLAVQICLRYLRPYLCVTFVRGANLPVVF